METAADPAPAVATGGAPTQTPAVTVAAVTTFPPDSIGREFDAAKFRVNEAGEPRRDTFGRFIPLKSGRNRIDGTPAQPRNGQKLPEPPPADFSDVEKIVASPAPLAPGADPIAPVADEYTTAAVATVSGLATAAILICGAHVKPSSDQVAAMVTSYADCYRAYGVAPKTPPWLGPVLATGAWIGPHLRSEQTQTNLQKTKAKLLGLLGWLRGRRDARTAANVSTEVEQHAHS